MEEAVHCSEDQSCLNKNDISLSQLENIIRTVTLEIHEAYSQQHIKLQQSIDDLTHQLAYNKSKLDSEYEAINDARLQVIEQQNKAIRELQSNQILSIIKEFIRPKIGVLYHHKPKMLNMPSRYNKKAHISNPPLISIVTPSYNQGRFIEKTLTSVLSQQYPALEYIIQDGKSTDNTTDVVKPYIHLLKNWDSTKDKGQSHAINLGFQHASGEIMAYLNSDDLLLPGTLHYVANYFKNNPEIDVIYGHRILIDEYEQEVGRWILPHHNNEILSWVDFIPQETLFWRRSIWEKAGGQLDESFKFAMDWDLILRFRNAGAKFTRLPRFLGAFRIHPHQKTSASMANIGMDEMNKLRLKYIGRTVSPAEIGLNIRAYKIKHVILHHLYKFGILRY